MSKHHISADRVDRNNTNLWRYDKALSSAMRKERYSKADPEAHMAYLDVSGEFELTADEYSSIDVMMDIDKFKTCLEGRDLYIFNLLMLGMRQAEIAEVVGLSQTQIWRILTVIKKRFSEFYGECNE